jgi:hypothetical protein
MFHRSGQGNRFSLLGVVRVASGVQVVFQAPFASAVLREAFCASFARRIIRIFLVCQDCKSSLSCFNVFVFVRWGGAVQTRSGPAKQGFYTKSVKT